MAALTAASAGLDLVSGYFGMTAADARAEGLRAQASLLVAENEQEARDYADEARKFKATQKLAYMKSGVAIEGTVLDVLDETERMSREKISAIRASGAAKAAALKAEASGEKLKGRMGFLTSALSGFKTSATAYSKLKGTPSKELKKQAADTSRWDPARRPSGYGKTDLNPFLPARQL